MEAWDIRTAAEGSLPDAAALAAQLWPHHTAETLRAEFEEITAQGGECFVLYAEGAAVGFAQCQLRHDYVEGTGTSPVGYLEGIYVAEDWRGRGCARELLAACEDWVRARGCREFASDCELDNEASIGFHRAVGFAEANRIVCFAKRL